jgi:hypothetical protein
MRFSSAILPPWARKTPQIGEVLPLPYLHGLSSGDFVRESAEAWADLLRDCKRRGMRAPVLAIGDGALGSGRPPGRCSRRPGPSAAGFTKRRCLKAPLPHCLQVLAWRS